MSSVKPNWNQIRSKYKYSARFEATASVSQLKEEARKTALASIDNLAGILDEEVAEKMRANPDLLYIVSKLINLNEANLNDDCLMAEDMIEVAAKFRDKYINVEHDKDFVVGALSSVGFSNIDTDELIEEDDLDKHHPNSIQLVVGGYLWRMVDSYLCEFIEMASASNNGKISTSFELLYNEYWIGVSPTRKVTDARIIVPQDKDYKEYDKLLRANAGAGEIDGNYVFRILKGNILPTGIGIVANPASGIKGILAVTDPEQITKDEGKEDDDHEDMEESTCKPDELTSAEVNQDGSLDEEKNINLHENSVIANIESKNNIIIPMKIESIEDISTQWSELIKNEASASVVTEFIIEKYKEPAKKFAEELKAKEELVATVEANKAEAEKKAADLEAAVANLTKELEEIRAAQIAAEASEAFNVRMAALDGEFDLDDEDRALLVDEVKSIESDEAFAKYMDKQKKLMKEKSKKFKAEKAAQVQETKEKEVDVKSVVASIVEDKNQEVSNGTAVTPSLKDQIYTAFSAKTTIGGKKMKEKSKKE